MVVWKYTKAFGGSFYATASALRIIYNEQVNVPVNLFTP